MADAPLRHLATVLFASGVVLAQSVIQGHRDFNGYWAWALICSSISVVACLTALSVAWVLPGQWAARSMLAMLPGLALLWLAGTGVMTLKEPFSVTGNGYFGAWAALLYSCRLLVEQFSAVRAPFERLGQDDGSLLSGLILASLTVLAQTSVQCSRSAACGGESAWIVLCSTSSLALCSFVAAPSIVEKAQPHFKFFALFLLVWWASGVFIATFYGPYAEWTGNGYFGCWAAFGVSACLAANTWGLPLTADDVVQQASSMGQWLPWELVVVCVASMVTLVASVIGCGSGCGPEGVWAVLCSTVSVGVCAVAVLSKLLDLDNSRVDRCLPYLPGLLVVLWAAGAGVTTFLGPFRATGNGYFGAWAALAFSWLLAARRAAGWKGSIEAIGYRGRELAVLVLASLVLLVQATVDAASGALPLDWTLLWALICSSCSLALALALLSLERLHDLMRWVAPALFAWWLCGVAVLTFHRPYIGTGNAYFASWAAAVASARLLCQYAPFADFLRTAIGGWAADPTSGEGCEGSAARPAAVVIGQGPAPRGDLEVPSCTRLPNGVISL